MIILNEELYNKYSEDQKVLNESVTIGALLASIIKGIGIAVGGVILNTLLYVAVISLVILILVGIMNLNEKSINKKINDNPELKKALIKAVNDCQKYVKKNITEYKDCIKWKECTDVTSKNVGAKKSNGKGNTVYFLRFELAEYKGEELFKKIYDMTPDQYNIEKGDGNPDYYPEIPDEVKSELRKIEDEISEINKKQKSTKLGDICEIKMEYNYGTEPEYMLGNFIYDPITIDLIIQIKSFNQSELTSETKENIKKLKESLK